LLPKKLIKITSMKIAFLNFYSGLVSRGAETFIHELASQLSQTEKVYVFQVGKMTKQEKYKVVTKVMPLVKIWRDDRLPDKHFLKRLFLNDRKLAELRFTLNCLSDLIKIRPDIIVPTNSGWQTLICRFFSKIIGAKTIITGHSGPGWDDRWNLLLKPNVFICLTKAQLKWAQKASIWKKQKFTLIPNGVDLKTFSCKLKKTKLNLPRPIIITVAAPSPSKRVEMTIKAVAKLPKASLLVIGSGSLNDEVDRLGGQLLGEKRYLRLSVNHPKMPSLYPAADIFTLCSDHTEAFGIAYLEALASNLPCVATDDLSRREIIGSAGIFVNDPLDSTEYAAKLDQALKISWGNKPRLRAEKYSWDKIAGQYLQMFKALLSS